MATQSNQSLSKQLETEEKFLPLLRYFIEKSIEEKKAKENIDDNDSGIKFSQFYERFMDHYPIENTRNVFLYNESPIERIFINSLSLLFIKSGLIGLQVTPPFKDTELEMNNFRIIDTHITKLTNDYVEMTGDREMNNFESFFQDQIKKGPFTQEDYVYFMYHNSVVKNFIWNAYHLTPQASFPNYKINNKTIRVDFLIWCPSNDKIKLIVECDGFKFHNNKESFENDRQRDRLLKLNGYDVIRFAGGEIWNDPIKVSEDLYEFLESYDNDKHLF